MPSHSCTELDHLVVEHERQGQLLEREGAVVHSEAVHVPPLVRSGQCARLMRHGQPVRAEGDHLRRTTDMVGRKAGIYTTYRVTLMVNNFAGAVDILPAGTVPYDR